MMAALIMATLGALQLWQDVSAPSHRGAVVVPAGEMCTVLIRTDKLEPVALPDDCTARILCVNQEQRTVYRNRPEEREASLPLYMYPRRMGPNTGLWAAQIKAPSRPGRYNVTFRLWDLNIHQLKEHQLLEVPLHVTAPPPAATIPFGFFSRPHRSPHGWNEIADMVAHGANMGAFVYRPEDLEVWKSFPNTRPQDCIWMARAADAPEGSLIYGVDEPDILDEPQVAEHQAWCHAHGLRAISAIKFEAYDAFNELIDIPVLAAQDWTPERLNKCAKPLWAYNCRLRGTNAPLHRYYSGLWAWAVQAKGVLLWCYYHIDTSTVENGNWGNVGYYEHALWTDRGPIPSVGLEGFRDGCQDWRYLKALEEDKRPEVRAWLKDLRRKVEWGFWPHGRGRDYSEHVWDVPDTAEPPVDLGAMRAKVVELLGVGQ